MSDLPWYKDGLNFKCTGCGNCCTGAPGYVWLTIEEAKAIAGHLNMAWDEFAKKYLRTVKGRLSLKELLPNYDCVFLKDKKCTVYEVRPKQCRTFPYWPQNMKSRQAWDACAKECEGINKDAPLVTYEEIVKAGKG